MHDLRGLLPRDKGGRGLARGCKRSSYGRIISWRDCGSAHDGLVLAK